MKNQSIANIQLHISENCSDLEKEILKLYWELEGLELLNTAKFIKAKFDITQSELTKIYKLGTLSFYIYCEHCNSYELHKAENHSKFKEKTKKVKYSSHQHLYFKCDSCKEIERIKNEAEIEEQRKEKELQKKNEMTLAIKNKKWQALSLFEKSVLQKAININFEDLTSYFKSKPDSNIYWRTLYKLDDIYLVNLIKNNAGYIDSVYALDELKNSFSFDSEKQKSKYEFNSGTNELKLKLTIDNERIHPDSPLYAGTITFKEDVILRANTEYIFGQWERANNNMFLTLTPITELQKRPMQKALSRLPMSIKEGVNNLLRDLGRSLDL